MGRGSRLRPTRLAAKLLQIRTALGLSQTEMLSRLGYAGEFTRSYVSGFETGVREPPLPILLAYAQAAGVCMDVLVNDELDLPTKLPSATKHTGLRRPASTQKGKRS